MFSNKRYVTTKIYEDLPFDLVCFIWNRIDVLNVVASGNIDPIQVFELKVLRNDSIIENQLVIHSSEQPEYKGCYALVTYIPFNGKVFVIDNGMESVMMFAAEY